MPIPKFQSIVNFYPHRCRSRLHPYPHPFTEELVLNRHAEGVSQQILANLMVTVSRVNVWIDLNRGRAEPGPAPWHNRKHVADYFHTHNICKLS